MEFDWNAGELAAGLKCYKQQKYFEAHEHWETLWRQAEGVEKTLLQALIQLSVAFCHRQRGNHRGAVSMLKKSLDRIALCPDSCGDINVARLRAEALAWLEFFARGEMGNPPAVPAIR